MAGSAGRDSRRAYHRLQRTHLRRGRADGRRRQPTITDIMAVDEIYSPYAGELVAAGRAQIEAEYRAYLGRTAATLQRRARLNEEILAGEHRVRQHRRLLGEAERSLTPQELQPRNSAEQRRSAEWLRSRREVMRDRRIAAATQRYERSIVDLAELRTGRADACQQLDRELAASRATARRIGELVAQQIAVYWRGVTVTHPEGEHLAGVLPMIKPELPEWVTVGHRCGFLEIPGWPVPDHHHADDPAPTKPGDTWHHDAGTGSHDHTTPNGAEK